MTPSEQFYLAVCAPAAKAHVGVLPLSYLTALYGVDGISPATHAKAIMAHATPWLDQVMPTLTAKVNGSSELAWAEIVEDQAGKIAAKRQAGTAKGGMDTFMLLKDHLADKYPGSHWEAADQIAWVLATASWLLYPYRADVEAALATQFQACAAEVWEVTGNQLTVDAAMSRYITLSIA